MKVAKYAVFMPSMFAYDFATCLHYPVYARHFVCNFSNFGWKGPCSLRFQRYPTIKICEYQVRFPLPRTSLNQDKSYEIVKGRLTCESFEDCGGIVGIF